MSLAHILERSSVGICLLCVGLFLLLWNSQRILSLHCLSISCLRGNLHLLVHCWPQSGRPYSRWPLWRVVKLSSFLRTSSSPITSHFMLYYFSSSSSSCTCSSFSNVIILYVAIFSRSPIVWWFFLTQIFLAPPVCSLGGPEPPPRSHTSMLLGTGGLGIFVLCMLVCHGLPFPADQCGLEGGTEIGIPHLGSCVQSTEELYLPCYLTQLLASLCSIGWFGICVFLLLDQLPYQAVELGLPGFL